jgi:replicative DNA helicase Mcm
VVHNTAAAVKDEVGDGRWTLEAGALVLADKGLACVDGEQTVVLKDGTSRMKDVRPGDVVVNFKKGWNEGTVLQKIDKGVEDCIGISLLTGDELVCTSDHKILTAKGWISAGKAVVGDSLIIPTDFISNITQSKSIVGDKAIGSLGGQNNAGSISGSIGVEAIPIDGQCSDHANILLNPILSIRAVGPRHVYDLVIEGEHNFLVNGGIVHNCIDELDKMTEQDRSSMHEAMESQRISVAKAGITATLQCRCSMLGAANPKYGRFDDNESLSDQINMPPALLSRFDLIFALTDRPKAETDARIAEHIIMGHVRGEVRRHEDLSVLDDLGVDYKKILEDTDKLKPVYDREFLRKYVAHAKRYVPVMSKDARKIIQEKYLAIRKLGEVQGASVPITARQLEAFIRLSEASARIRLSNIVAKEDAERAVRIVEFYLNKMARDSGSMDVDKVMTGFSKTDRNKIAVVRTLIHSNSEPGKGVSFKTLLEHAPEKNLTEQELRDALKKLRNGGDIYEPSHDFYKLSSGD